MSRKLYVGNLPYDTSDQELTVNEARPKTESGGGGVGNQKRSGKRC